MREFILYGTSACHLCEQAETVLANVLAVHADWRIALVDIAERDDWIAQYGTRIPVFAEGQRELDWPFDEAAVTAFAEQSQ